MPSPNPENDSFRLEIASLILVITGSTADFIKLNPVWKFSLIPSIASTKCSFIDPIISKNLSFCVTANATTVSNTARTPKSGPAPIPAITPPTFVTMLITFVTMLIREPSFGNIVARDSVSVPAPPRARAKESAKRENTLVPSISPPLDSVLREVTRVVIGENKPLITFPKPPNNFETTPIVEDTVPNVPFNNLIAIVSASTLKVILATLLPKSSHALGSLLVKEVIKSVKPSIRDSNIVPLSFGSISETIL